MTLSLFRFDRPTTRLWAFAMMGLARRPLSRMAGLSFWKLCGSGTGQGFTPLPNLGVYAILAVWSDRATAQRQLCEADLFDRYRRRAKQHWTLMLAPLSARGQWAGQTPFSPDPSAQPVGPIAALTRATLRPRAALRFWQRVPCISDAIGSDDKVLFKIGIGEVPLLHQITFSLWPDTASMNAFARHPNGPHAAAIAAVRQGGWFKEDLYARFQLIEEYGNWGPNITPATQDDAL